MQNPNDIETEVQILDFPHPGEGTSPADKRAALDQFRAEFDLAPDATPGDVIQYVMNRSGHAMTFATLLSIALVMGADLQLHVINNESDDVRI